ncbi:MAG: hypothetical protein ACXVDB_00955, partial [Tumebacillaceae bacterium]
VVAQSESNDQKAAVESLVGNFAMQKAITGQVNWVAAGGGAPALTKIVQQGQTDLVLWSADSGDVQAVAQKNDQVRFAVIGADKAPTLSNVRNLTTDHKRLLFLAGFLAAEANRESSEPFTVLVDTLRTVDDPDWQLILAGSKFAGRHDLPRQVLSADLAPPKEDNQTSANGQSATEYTPPKQPVRLTGRSVLLLDSLPAEATSKIKELGLKVIRTDQSGKPNAVQSNVVAEPASILQDAVQEEGNVLAAGKWSGKQVVSITPKHSFVLLQAGLFTDKDLSGRLDIIDDQLANGSLKPDTYLNQ